MKIQHQHLLAAAIFAVTFSTNAQTPPLPKDKPGKSEERWRDKFMEGMSEEMCARFQEVREDALKDPQMQALMKEADAASKKFRDDMRKTMSQLDPELTEKFRTHFQEVRENALKDPQVQALMKEADAASKKFRDAMREAMMQRDPELAEKVLTHLEEIRKNPGYRLKPRKDRPADSEKPLISPEQRDRMQKAREIAKQAPAVQSAEAKLKSATTPEERQQAGKEFHQAMRAAMLTADPTLADVLEKIRPSRPPEPKPEDKPQAPSAD